ncbi:hypothetical protein FCJ61_15135 [Burkholderia metallica]|uniref:hypothetical protein n=1 Tax=Burkholderia cepacia complex TaxID=87882 RepID=UPI00157B1A8F|nr:MULTISPECIES: hypothetical protein [Burkholderia cepacia complex]NTZ84292.1 hypothetical protein [Burkholderia metallica]
MTDKNIEVFQNLHLKSRTSARSVRAAILAQVQGPWHHDLEREKDARSHAAGDEDVIVLCRDAFDDVDESCLLLWQEGEGYKVPNIVPRSVGQLSITKYNAILRDFVTKVAEPAAHAGGFEIELSSPHQSLDDWLDAEPAAALRRFSQLANKSTGAGHPMDRDRWYAFLIATHDASRRVDPDQLVRWLVEVEHWPVDTAHDLAIDYESALGLLRQYDQSRS